AMQQGDDLQALLEGSAVATQEISLVGQENQQHEASIHALSIELVDNQECILSGGNDNTLRLWQRTADGWDLEKILRGHGRWVRACSFSAAGKAVLSGAYDGLKRWDWEAYSMPRELYPNSERRVGSESSEVGRSAASQARYSPDGRWIATAYANGTVAVWDAAANEQMPSQLLVDGHAFLTDTGIFYDNGGRLLTSAGDNTTRLWDVSRSTQMHSLQGTGWRGTAAVSWRPQESTAWIVTGSDDRLIPAWLWRVSDGKPISKQPLLTDYAQSVLTQLAHTAQRPVQYAAAQSPLGKLPTADVDRLHRWMDKIPDVTAVAFSDSGDRLLIGNSGGHCFLYHLPTATAAPQQVAQFTVAGSSVRAATFLPSGDSVITASAEGQLQQWDAAQGQLQRLLPGSAPVTSLAISPNGHRLLVGYAPLEGHSMPIARLLNIASPNAGVQAELLASNRLASRDWQANPPVVQSIRFAPKSNRALLSLFFPTRKGGEAANSDATQTGYELGYWNWDQQNLDFQSLVTPISGEVASTAFGEGPSDSQLLVVGGKGARLLAPATDREAFTRLTASFRPANTITCLGFSYDPTRHLSNRLAAGDSEGNVRVWERNAGQWSENSGAAVQLTGRHNAPLVATVFDPQRPNRLLTADQTGKWILWQFDGDWQIQQQFVPQPQAPRAHCAMFSPDGQRVFLGSETRAQQWRRQADDRYEITESHGIAEKVQAAAYSADGCWLVTFDGENAVKFWDASGQIASLADEDAEAITAMALSHDRRRFFTAHQDRRIVIWDTSKLEDTQRGDRSQNEKLIHELLTLEGHRRGVTSISVAPNGRQLLSAGEEGRTILWTGEPIRPMSLTLSRTQIPYQRGSGEMKIDARVVVADPSQLADFAQAELRIALQGATFPHERLHFGPSTESSGAAIDIRPDGSIYYQPQQDASGIAIGQLLSDTPQLKHIALQPTADAAALQVLLRTLTYSVAAPDTFSTPTQDAVPTAETSQLVQGDRQQTVTIQLTGVRERDDRGDPRPLTPQELRASGLQASLVIDIE
ncbi:MAG: WD40 repeat domain-containing protein, partial [Planctomycetales bacterium]|nr:WD40 repeat domain-containing protein [Planctomycetales bacterium]